VITLRTTGPCGVNCTRFVYVTPGISTEEDELSASACGAKKRARSREIARRRRTIRGRVAASRDDVVIDIVLVHSGVTDSGEWNDVRPLLERHHRVVAPDLPGFGSEPLLPGEVSLGAHVLGSFEGTAALVGTSWGGRAVLEAALAAPERVAKLVLIDANVFGWSEEVQRLQQQEESLFEAGRLEEAAELMARSWLVGPQREPDEVDGALYDRVRSMVERGYELQTGVDASIRRVEIELEQISAPTLVLRGALDWPDVAVAAERFVRELLDAREAVIEGSAHLPSLERPDEVARLVLEFLSEPAADARSSRS
jgi:3-oxoadipate enol-lactonase